MLPQGRPKQTVTPYNTMQDHITRFCNTLHKMYACFIIKILHVGKSRVANMRLALQSLGRKVIFLQTLLYATHNFRNDSELYEEEQYDLNREILTVSVHI